MNTRVSVVALYLLTLVLALIGIVDNQIGLALMSCIITRVYERANPARYGFG